MEFFDFSSDLESNSDWSGVDSGLDPDSEPDPLFPEVGGNKHKSKNRIKIDFFLNIQIKALKLSEFIN